MPRRLEHEWFFRSLPDNVLVGEDVYIDSAFGFAAFSSERDVGLRAGRGSGLYDRATVIAGPAATIQIGEFACLNGTYLICHEAITIGPHALLAWGCVITDGTVGQGISIEARRRVLEAAARDERRRLRSVCPPDPVVLEENVWVGFDSVILPGVRVGRGSIVGCKTIVTRDVPPYSVVVGNPARWISSLEPDDTDERRAEIMANCVRGVCA